MTYVAFKADRDYTFEDRIKAISLLLITPETQYSGTDTWHPNLGASKMFATKKEILIGNLICYETQESRVSIIKFPKKLTTDKYLLSFEDAYLGCLPEKTNKDELINKIKLYKKLHQNDELVDYLKINVEILNQDKNFGLNEKELDEIKNLQSTYHKSLEKWVLLRKKSIEKSIKQLPKFLNKGF